MKCLKTYEISDASEVVFEAGEIGDEFKIMWWDENNSQRYFGYSN